MKERPKLAEEETEEPSPSATIPDASERDTNFETRLECDFEDHDEPL